MEQTTLTRTSPASALRNVTYVLVSIASVIFISQEQCAYYPTAAECLNGSGN